LLYPTHILIISLLIKCNEKPKPKSNTKERESNALFFLRLSLHCFLVAYAAYAASVSALTLNEFIHICCTHTTAAPLTQILAPVPSQARKTTRSIHNNCRSEMETEK